MFAYIPTKTLTIHFNNEDVTAYDLNDIIYMIQNHYKNKGYHMVEYSLKEKEKTWFKPKRYNFYCTLQYEFDEENPSTFLTGMRRGFDSNHFIYEKAKIYVDDVNRTLTVSLPVSLNPILPAF